MFIHYGAERFDPLAVRPVKNVSTRGIKPTGGFWACPTGAHWSWERHLLTEQYNLTSLEKSFRFDLHQNAKLLTVNSLKDLSDFTVIKQCMWDVDWEAVFKQHDALLLTDQGLESHVACDPGFQLRGNWFGVRPFWYMWDAATLLVSNPEVVVY